MYPTTEAHIYLYSAARKCLNLRHRRDALIATPAHSGRQGRNRTYGVSDVLDLQSNAFASYAYLPLFGGGSETRTLKAVTPNGFQDRRSTSYA